MSASATRNSHGGWIKRRVRPRVATIPPRLACATVSSTRMVVVPTAKIRPPAALVELIASSAFIQLEPLLVHCVLLHLISLYRCECSQPNMQHELVNSHS